MKIKVRHVLERRRTPKMIFFQLGRFGIELSLEQIDWHIYFDAKFKHLLTPFVSFYWGLE